MDELLNLMLNADETISEIVDQHGTLTYLIVFAIIFIETGLVVVTFFPGDGLLFSVGILAASGEMNLWTLLVLLIVATVLGNTSNYLIGRFIGKRFFRKQKIRRNQYLSKAFDYYEKYGVWAIVMSRFFPFLRSFVPFVSGISEMKFGQFTWANIIGGIAWICLYILLGFFLGEIPWVKEHYGLVLSISLTVILLVMLIGALKVLWQNYFARKCPF